MSETHPRHVSPAKDSWTAIGVVISAIGIIATAVVAYIGWQRTADDQAKAERDKETAQLLSDQIHYLYGPLYGEMRASTEAWLAFRKAYRPNQPYWGGGTPPNETEQQAWRTWMRTVFIPLNDKMEATILSNAHLIDGTEMPQVFVEFLHHAESYKPVIAEWDQKNFTHETSDTNYPQGFNKYVCEEFVDLKSRQADLLHFAKSTSRPNCDDSGKSVVGSSNELQAPK